MIKDFITIYIGIGLVVAVGFVTRWLTSGEYNKGYQDGYDYIKSVKELQQQVGAVPDGIIGKETLGKWDKAICDKYASKYDYMYEVEK